MIRKSQIEVLAEAFPLSWSHYVASWGAARARPRPAPSTKPKPCAAAGRSGNSIGRSPRLLRTHRPVAQQGGHADEAQPAQPEDRVTAEEEVKDPLVLEFLGLKDEYSESDLEEALIRHLESFLLELGGDFTFVGRQRRLRIGDAWYRIDLLFYHRRLRSLVIIDLKIGRFTHADAGQMHLYLNYAREHWMLPGENPPIGLILCNQKDEAVAHYALEGLPNKVMAAQYRPSPTRSASPPRSSGRVTGSQGAPALRDSRDEAAVNTNWPKVQLGEVLRQRMPDATVDPTETYNFAGVYSFARGVFRGQARLEVNSRTDA